MNLNGRSFNTLIDFSKEEILYLIDLAIELKDQKNKGIEHKIFPDKNIVVLFQKDSTRTRCSFEVAAYDLGMNVTYLGPNGSQMNVKESVKDTARVLGRFYDGIEFRGYKQSDVEALAMYSGVPIWNGLTDLYHPTQILADLMTIKEVKGDFTGLTFTYVGDARYNMGNSLMIGCAKLGINFKCVSDKAYYPSDELITVCKEFAKNEGSTIEFSEDPLNGVKGSDFIYTDVWVSMGEDKSVWDERLEKLSPFQVTKQMMSKANKDCKFMHCLPAFHGLDTDTAIQVAAKYKEKYPMLSNGELEVTDEVFESENSIVFDEAENRMHTIKALMYSTIKK